MKTQLTMKSILMLSAVLSLGFTVGVSAQATDARTKQAAAKKTPATALKRTGSGKMAEGVSRSGNTNLSPVQSTTQPTLKIKEQPKTATKAKSTKNGTGTDMGLTTTGSPNNGTNKKVVPTSDRKKVRADGPKGYDDPKKKN